MFEKVLFFLPDSFMGISIAVVGLGLIIGLFSIRRALRLLGLIVLLLISGPFIDALMKYLRLALPTWLLLLLGAAFILCAVRAALRLILGPRAMDEMTGVLAADIVRCGFKAILGLIALPFRIFRKKSGRSVLHG